KRDEHRQETFGVARWLARHRSYFDFRQSFRLSEILRPICLDRVVDIFRALRLPHYRELVEDEGIAGRPVFWSILHETSFPNPASLYCLLQHIGRALFYLL